MAKATTHRRSKGMTVPVAVLAGFAPLATYAYLDFKQGGVKLAGEGMLARLTGINLNADHYDWAAMGQGLFPILGGLLVHKYIGGKMGVNRMLANAGVPLIRL